MWEKECIYMYIWLDHLAVHTRKEIDNTRPAIMEKKSLKKNQKAGFTLFMDE